RDLFGTRVRGRDLLEPFGQVNGGLSTPRPAVPGPLAAWRHAGDKLEKFARIPRAKCGIPSRNRREDVARRALAGHRTTATATPSCVGTMMPSTRESVAMRRLNSRT